ncbi:Inter-alpha-trypsin inhibitor domain protein [hydrothermal vent metagenome]|uniref:Inter-alpha-trypsin inhibitor domain protein n=1 Tax=hydrothermal vent metagenome TaxID=652676 RepID=A0A3B0XNN4_9ZZZZ
MLSLNSHFFKRRPRTEYLYEHYRPRRSPATRWLLRTFKTFVPVLLGIVLGMLIMMLSKPAHADSADHYVSMNDISEGSLLLKGEAPEQYKRLALLDTQLDMNISGMIARSHIRQSFKNTSNNWIEAVYVFPLPETAAVDHMRIQIGERIIEGQIKEKQQARKIYQQARHQGKKAALVEQQRPNLFTNTVANIAPGETVIIEIEYQQTLEYEQGRFSLRFPMTITPRYIPGKPLNQSLAINGTGWEANTDQVKDASFISPPVSNTASSISLNIYLTAGFPVQKITSPYHAITRQKMPDGRLLVQLTRKKIPAKHDFELNWTPEIKLAPKAAFFSEKINNDFYHLLMLLPPYDNTQTAQALAREVIYVIDTSGSMHGTSMEQAKQSLLMALDRLRLHDRFNIIQFNSITHPLFYHSRTASVENIQQAKEYTRGLRADGGTEMAAALNLALKQPAKSDHVRQVVFLTDGSVGNETALFEIIHKNLASSRLFTVGIGSAPNSYFMRKAAQFGRGSFTHISDINEVDNKMSNLFKRLENPLMTDLEIEFEKGTHTEMWPARIADLYHGGAIVLAIKTDKPLQQVNLQGTRALSPWQATLDLTQNNISGDTMNSNGIGRFWARRKIAALMDSVHSGANKSRVRNKVIDIALNHHLVSKYTSLVAVDVEPSRPAEKKIEQQALPVNLAQGQTAQKTFGQLPQTATSAGVKLLTGTTLLLLALITQLLFSRKRKLKILCS